MSKKTTDLSFLKKLKVSLEIDTEPLDRGDNELQYISGRVSFTTDQGKEINIGSVRAYRIYSDDYDFWTLDGESQDLGVIASGIENFRNEEDGDYGGDYLMVDHLKIDKEYRGRGVGKFLLAHIIYGTTGSFDHVFLNPKPFELTRSENIKEYNKAKKRLIKFYKDLGFRNIDDTEILTFRSECVLSLGSIHQIMPRKHRPINGSYEIESEAA